MIVLYHTVVTSDEPSLHSGLMSDKEAVIESFHGS